MSFMVAMYVTGPGCELRTHSDLLCHPFNDLFQRDRIEIPAINAYIELQEHRVVFQLAVRVTIELP